MRMALAAILVLVIFSLSDGRASAQSAGRGLGSGRASPSDVAHLAIDIGKVLNAERWINARQNDSTRIGNEILDQARQRQLLGVDEDAPQAEVAAAGRRWWVEHILQPALDIAANPAASCELARQMLRRILALERQAQILGMEEARFGEFGDGESIIGRAFLLLQQRCLADAFDECMETGNGKALIGFAASFRMVEGDPHLLEQAVYLFRRCTVYSLVYHLELDGTISDVHESVVADGSHRMLFESEGGDAVTRLGTGMWFGPRPQDFMSPNMLLSSLDCGVAAVSCALEDPPMGGRAQGRLSMVRYTHPQTVRYVPDRRWEMEWGGHAVFEPDTCEGGQVQPSEGCREGEDQAEISFGPPDFFTIARLRPNYGPLTRQGPSSDIYYLATIASAIDPATIGEWRREGYPLLFTAEIDRTENTTGVRGGVYRAHVRATFELRHRPDLYPPEEIDPRLELLPPPEPPPRIPAT